MEKEFRKILLISIYIRYDEYIELVIDFIESTEPLYRSREVRITIPQRATDRTGLGFKEFEFTAKVNKRIEERDTRQGRLFQV